MLNPDSREFVFEKKICQSFEFNVVPKPMEPRFGGFHRFKSD